MTKRPRDKKKGWLDDSVNSADANDIDALLEGAGDGNPIEGIGDGVIDRIVELDELTTRAAAVGKGWEVAISRARDVLAYIRRVVCAGREGNDGGGDTLEERLVKASRRKYINALRGIIRNRRTPGWKRSDSARKWARQSTANMELLALVDSQYLLKNIMIMDEATDATECEHFARAIAYTTDLIATSYKIDAEAVSQSDVEALLRLERLAEESFCDSIAAAWRAVKPDVIRGDDACKEVLEMIVCYAEDAARALAVNNKIGSERITI